MKELDGDTYCLLFAWLAAIVSLGVMVLQYVEHIA
jgi:hypothetical protein